MKKLNIKIITEEVTIPKTSRYERLLSTAKKLRHGDGSLNIVVKGWNSEEEFNNSTLFLDEGSETDDLIFPPSSLDPEIGITEIQDFFGEIFHTEVSSISSLSPDFKGDIKYIFLIDPEYLNTSSDKFKNLDRKYWAFKRYMWERSLFYNGTLPGSINPNSITINTGLINFPAGEALVFEGVAFIWGPGLNQKGTTAHEAGHLYGLAHWGDSRDDPKRKAQNISYYGGGQPFNKDWAPIMGIKQGSSSQKFQWSNGNYLPKWNIFQDDIKTISKHGDLKKPPKTVNSLIYYNNVRELKRAKKMSRILNESSKPNTGMIGFPYDYDIVKILLPKGLMTVSVEPINNSNAMLDFDADILYCDCELDKEKESIDMQSEFDSFWTPEGETNITRKIVINNDDKYVYKSLHDDTKRSSINFTLDLQYPTLVYLRIRGDYVSPVDKKEDTPIEEDKGQDRYGSLGRYTVRAIVDSAAFHDDIPNAHCETFSICGTDNKVTKIKLFLQDEKDEQINGKDGGVSILETPVIINGQRVTKRFLVLGFAIPINAPENKDRFYLPFFKNGESMKQAFVLGIGTDSD